MLVETRLPYMSHCVSHSILETMLSHCVAHGIVAQPCCLTMLHMALLLNLGNSVVSLCCTLDIGNNLVSHGVVTQPWKQCCLTVLHMALLPWEQCYVTVLLIWHYSTVGTMLSHCCTWRCCSTVETMNIVPLCCTSLSLLVLHMALLLNRGNNEHCPTVLH